jgi:hypothetical protein
MRGAHPRPASVPRVAEASCDLPERRHASAGRRGVRREGAASILEMRGARARLLALPPHRLQVRAPRAAQLQGSRIVPELRRQTHDRHRCALTDRVVAFGPVRQFVLSFPYRLRYHLAYDHDRCTAVLKIFMRAVLSFHRRRAREQACKAAAAARSLSCSASARTPGETRELVAGVFGDVPNVQLMADRAEGTDPNRARIPLAFRARWGWHSRADRSRMSSTCAKRSRERLPANFPRGGEKFRAMSFSCKETAAIPTNQNTGGCAAVLDTRS